MVPAELLFQLQAEGMLWDNHPSMGKSTTVKEKNIERMYINRDTMGESESRAKTLSTSGSSVEAKATIPNMRTTNKIPIFTGFMCLDNK